MPCGNTWGSGTGLTEGLLRPRIHIPRDFNKKSGYLNIKLWPRGCHSQSVAITLNTKNYFADGMAAAQTLNRVMGLGKCKLVTYMRCR